MAIPLGAQFGQSKIGGRGPVARPPGARGLNRMTRNLEKKGIDPLSTEGHAAGGQKYRAARLRAGASIPGDPQTDMKHPSYRAANDPRRTGAAHPDLGKRGLRSPWWSLREGM